jgi:hypothetical protein
MTLDTSNWSGEGAFTQVVVDFLNELEHVAEVRVEDAPASRSDADYNFISNEIFVRFAVQPTEQREKKWGVLPVSRVVDVKKMTMAQLETALAAAPDIGEPDYSDEGMLQYLRTERIIPPYQTRGYKLVELVRVYEAGTPRRE